MLTPNASQKNFLVDIHIDNALRRAEVILFPHIYQIIDSSEAVDHVSITCFSVVMKMMTKRYTVIQHAYFDSLQFLAGS